MRIPKEIRYIKNIDDSKYDRLVEHIEGKKFKDLEITKTKKEKLLETLKALDGVDSINMFVKDAYNQAKDAEKRFELILKNTANKDSKDILTELAAINNFANSYRNMYVGWVKNAKTKETRKKRISEVVKNSLENKKTGIG